MGLIRTQHSSGNMVESRLMGLVRTILDAISLLRMHAPLTLNFHHVNRAFMRLDDRRVSGICEL